MNKTMRTLAELLPDLELGEFAALEVTGITQDSREVNPGDLFCARAGGSYKGVDFVRDAVSKGAAAVLLDGNEVADGIEASVPLISVKDLVCQLGHIASRFYGEPSKQLCMIGVTGTNGKTSCSHFLAQALNAAGKCTAVIGTVGNGFPGELVEATHTTPDAIGLHRLLAQFRAQGASAVVMEVSSHAIDQHRIGGVQFDMAMFTNLSRDHLDYHGTMAAYGGTKEKLFTEWHPGQAVICLDDTFGKALYERLRSSLPVFGYGERQGDVKPCEVEFHRGGIEARLASPWGEISFKTQVVGDFNLWNLMQTAAVLGALGYNADEISGLLSGLSAVPGRMQCIGRDGQPLVIVDYAHTPDALLKALQASRKHTQGELYCVFGCGGDRDQGKRAEMGAIAGRYADRVIVTSDNPRSEDSQKIIDMILSGLNGNTNIDVVLDRGNAIRRAVTQARLGDVVLIAGKGHENYQEVNGVRLPFLDEQVVDDSLQEWQS